MMSKIYTKIVISMVTGEVLEEHSYDHVGPVALCKEEGPTKEQTSISKEAHQMYASMAANYATMFGQSSAILGSLQSKWNPVLKAGINQYGFSKPEDAALRAQAIQGTGAEYRKAAAATGNAISAIGGGNSALPSGSMNAIQRNVAVRAAESEADKGLEITAAGYQTGRENFLNASKVLSSAPGELMRPVNEAGTVSTAGGTSAMDDANKIQELQAIQSSPWSTVGGILGSVAGTALLGPVGGAIGGKIANKITGGGIGAAGA